MQLAWHDERDGNQEIYGKGSADGGLAWGADQRLTDDAAVSNYASIWVAGTNVHVAWFDERDGNTEIYYKHSGDAGQSWTDDRRLTVDDARSTDPVVGASGAFVHVVWTDARDNVPVYTGNYEIYYKRDPTGNLPGTPGATPDGDEVLGPPLILSKAGSSLVLSWGAACSDSATDYAVYEGALGDFASHAPVTCTTAGETLFALTAGSGSGYYLVVPHDASNEGSYGTDSAGAERPPATAACLPQLVGACP